MSPAGSGSRTRTGGSARSRPPAKRAVNHAGYERCTHADRTGNPACEQGCGQSSRSDAYPSYQPAGHREPPRRPVTARETTSRPAKSWLGRGVLIAGLAMIPWVLILACSLPPTIRAAHWSTAWAGLDALEAAGLMTTGAALIGRCSWLCLPAAITSTLLVADAWFDITTSAPGHAATVAIAMAVFPELPLAGLCAALAIRHAPGCTARHRHASPHEHLALLTTGAGTGSSWRVSSGHRGRSSPAKGRSTRCPPVCDPTA